SGPVLDALDARVRGAVRTAEEPAAALGTVADDPAAAVLAGRRDRMDRALERVVGAAAAVGQGDLEGLVVLVATDIASGHGAYSGGGNAHHGSAAAVNSGRGRRAGGAMAAAGQSVGWSCRRRRSASSCAYPASRSGGRMRR